MFKIKESVHIIVAIILFAFIISFLQGLNAFSIALIVTTIILLVNIIAKKIAAYYFGAEIEQKIWQFQRWGYYERSKFKKPKPLGIILPFLLVWISYPIGFLKILTFLQTDTKGTIARAAKIHGGLRRFTELTEWHISLILGIGIIANLVLAIIAYLLKSYHPIIPDIAKYSIYYCIWNILPISQLDGTKIFFGSKALWFTLLFFTILGLVFALFLI